MKDYLDRDIQPGDIIIYSGSSAWGFGGLRMVMEVHGDKQIVVTPPDWDGVSTRRGKISYGERCLILDGPSLAEVRKQFQ